MTLEFKKDDKFEDLGSIKTFFSKYGGCTVSIDDIDEPNIALSVISNQEIEFKIFCSRPLSDIIRQERGFPQGMENYRILRITKHDGSSYIRVSQSIDIVGDSNTPLADNMEQLNDIQGNVSLVFEIDEIKGDTSKPPNFDDLIAF